MHAGLFGPTSTIPAPPECIIRDFPDNAIDLPGMVAQRAIGVECRLDPRGGGQARTYALPDRMPDVYNVEGIGAFGGGRWCSMNPWPEVWIMRFAILNLGRAGLCLAIWLCGAPGASGQGRDYSDLIDRRNFQQSTYRIRVPDVADPSYQIPVVVILHDAGRNGSAIINDERLIEAFVGKGYAVLAPDALPRRNARIHYRGNKPGPMALQAFVLPMTYSKKRFVMRDIDGTVRVLKHRTDSGWYFYNVDQAIYSYGRPKIDLLGRDEIQSLRNVLAHAAEEYGIDPNPVLIIGLGHGGSLVW